MIDIPNAVGNRIYFPEILCRDTAYFRFFHENSHSQIKSLYLIEINFLVLTKVINEEHPMLWSICRVETKIEDGDCFNYSVWKNSFFEGFFTSHEIAHLPNASFLKLCVMLLQLSHSGLRDMCGKSWKISPTSNMYEFIKIRISAEKAKLHRYLLKSFWKTIFVFYSAWIICHPILYENNKDSWNEFLKMFSFVNNNSRGTTF